MCQGQSTTIIIIIIIHTYQDEFIVATKKGRDPLDDARSINLLHTHIHTYIRTYIDISHVSNPMMTDPTYLPTYIHTYLGLEVLHDVKELIVNLRLLTELDLDLCVDV